MKRKSHTNPLRTVQNSFSVDFSCIVLICVKQCPSGLQYSWNNCNCFTGVLYNADEYSMLDEDANKTQSATYEVLHLDKKITVEDSLYEPVTSPNKKRKGKNDKAK